MKRSYQITNNCCLVGTLLGVTLTISAAHADPFLSVPPASFLNYHVDTSGQLAQQIQLDPVVRARLAKHFGMTEAALVAYVQNNLVRSSLSEAGRYRVACVRSSGKEYWISERLASGTPVFALRGTNQPILRLVCGNPLVSTLPKVEAKAAPLAPAKVAAAPAASAQAVPAAPASLKTVAFAPASSLSGPGAGTLGPLTRVGGAAQTLGGGHSGLLPILGVAGIVPFLPHGGGGSSPGTPSPAAGPTPSPTPTPGGTTPPSGGVVIPTGTVPAPPPSEAAVPEPSPALFFGLAGVGLIVLRMQARRRAH